MGGFRDKIETVNTRIASVDKLQLPTNSELDLSTLEG